MKNLSRAAVLLIAILSYFVYLAPLVFCGELSYPAEISGKILDKDGKPFIGNVTVVITANILTDVTDYTGDRYKHNEYKQIVTGGTFSWKGQAENINLTAEKDGYYSSSVWVEYPWRENEIKVNDILIYMIPKGTPSTLEFTRGAEINEKDNKPYGWSFKKRWYFPANEEETVWLRQSFDEEGYPIYTMKEPGGFVLFLGYPSFESKPDEHGVAFEFMTEAPEEGYVQSISPSIDNRDRVKSKRDVYYYFRTPDGKYGKICFHGSFDYYLQPDGSRNLEAGEVVDKGPRNPIESEWLDKELGPDN